MAARGATCVEVLPERLGFRVGARGTHTSRTIMFAELEMLLAATPESATKADYRTAIIDDNVLGKKTVATRRLSAQRLSELYALDSGVPLFRVMRKFWGMDADSRRLLALLCAAARDPLLRMTATPILDAREGETITNADLEAALAEAAPGRFNTSILNKIARNARSSWTQSGHLRGHTVKIRTHPRATPATVTYALLLGHLAGQRGRALLNTCWTRMHDVPAPAVLQLAADASRRGWIDLLRSGDVVEVRFRNLLTRAEEEACRELH